ncbi:MAG: hypothetical protein EOP94_03905 [Zymomonas sp.]|nr:MAG: hypothetical protein EOP94_03905 [Zymomonas sp.]
MSEPRPSTIERAFEHARSGRFRTRSQIGKAMAREGYTISEVVQLQGPAITKQLNTLCRKASDDGETVTA